MLRSQLDSFSGAMVRVNMAVFFPIACPFAAMNDVQMMLQLRSSSQNVEASFGESVAALQTSRFNTSAVQAILADVQADPGSWSAEEKQKLLAAFNAMKTDMMKVLDEERTSDQESWNLERAKMKQCHDTTSLRFDAGGDVQAELSAAENLREKHKLCRKVKFSLDQYKEQAGHFCDAQANVGWGTDLTASTHAIGNANNALTTLKADKVAYKLKDPAETDCTVAQANYENQFCMWRKTKRFSCEAERDCIQVLDLPGLRSRLETRVQQRRDLRVILTKSSCYIQHLLQQTFNDADKSEYNPDQDPNCEAASVEPALDNVNFPEHVSQRCQEAEDVKPTGQSCDAFINKFYDNWDDHDVISQCEATCQDPVRSAKPTATAGCVDAGGADCSLFHNHHDACNHEVYAEASAKCCACGGGINPVLKVDCSCTMSCDNYIQKVYIDGEEVTSQVSGDLYSWPSLKTLSFKCGSDTVMALMGSDAEGGCSNGGCGVKCSSTDSSSPWNGFGTSTEWKAWSGSCNSGSCQHGVTSPPAGWYLPEFNDDSWDFASIGHRPFSSSAGEAICHSGGNGWLFRSPTPTR